MHGNNICTNFNVYPMNSFIFIEENINFKKKSVNFRKHVINFLKKTVHKIDFWYSVYQKDHLEMVKMSGCSTL